MVTVRRANEDDFDALCALLEILPRDGPLPIDRRAASEVYPRILEQPGRALLVAEVDGVVVGTTDVIVIANLSRGARPYALVENVVVAPGARRAGVGRALMSAAVEHARESRCYKVQLLSNERRVEAHALYESAGFEPNATGFRFYF